MCDAFIDYYKVLNVKFDASSDEIRRAFRDAAMRWHPDLNNDSEAGSNEMMGLVNKAWETLRNSSRRAEYDRLWLEHRRATDEESVHWEQEESWQTRDGWERDTTGNWHEPQSLLSNFLETIRRTPIWVQILIWILVLAFIVGILAGMVWVVIEIVQLVIELVKFIIELLKAAAIVAVVLGLGWLVLQMSNNDERE